MRPQLQKHLGDVPGEFGDCHRTCVAMILNMDRDEVPHFMEDLPPSTPADDPRHRECERREVEWLARHGLAPVNIPFPGEQDIAALLTALETLTHGAPVVLGCSSPNGDHSVVVWRGEIYNPSNGTIVGPMHDGFWWLTIYSVAGNWQTRDATRELSFSAGWNACFSVVFGGDNPSRPGCLQDALTKHLQPAPAPATVAPQEADSDGS